MKKYQIVIIIIIAIISFAIGLFIPGKLYMDNSVEEKRASSSEDNPNMNKQKADENAKEQEAFEKSDFKNMTDKSIRVYDFKFTDGKNEIRLDKPFNDLKPFKEISSSFLGDFYYGDYAYKFYIHKYDGFEIYSSNARYESKDRDFDEYFISNITVKDFKLRTLRGVTVGSSFEDVIQVYGEGLNVTDKENNSSVEYRLEDKVLIFKMDAKKYIKEIIMKIDL